MKKIFNPFSLALILLTGLFFLSCKKDNNQSSSTNSFIWTFNGITDSASLSLAYLDSGGVAGESKIIAGTGVSIYYSDKIWIILPSLNATVYTFSAGSHNSIIYFDDHENLNSIAGSVTITDNKHNQISGNFSATLVNSTGTQKSISGSFTGITVY